MKKTVAALLCALFVFCADSRATPPRDERDLNHAFHVESAIDVARVPAGFPVPFCLLTHGGRQYVAYYDEARRMTVAARGLDSREWQYQVLPSKVGWASHNYVTMAVDDEGQIHLSGNMHCVPLIYFRTSRPGDITTFKRIAAMTGANENRCTYPRFMRGADGALVFHYRDGGSGNGNQIFNVYDHRTHAWRRLLDKPLTDGRGEMNAYLAGPVRGPDGWFHLCWVWRDTPDCRTNHDPSYARSRDLIHGETAAGGPSELPITSDTPGALIDPIPAGGGIINGALRIGFDGSNRPLASYFKFDNNGKTQVYVARFENEKWTPHKITDWDYRWEFGGGGSINSEIRLGAVQSYGDNELAIPFSHIKYGSGLLVFDEQTLQLVGTEKSDPQYPANLCKPESTFPGMTVRWAEDVGVAPGPPGRYVLRWETLPQNRDRPRKGPLPEPAMLKLYKLSSAS